MRLSSAKALLPLVLFVASGCADDQDSVTGPSDPNEVLGQVTAFAALPMNPPIHDLLGLPPDEFSTAQDVNNLGVVVGHFGGRAWKWRRGGFRFLPTLGGEGSEAQAINYSGITVGRSQTAGGHFHATLWRGRKDPVDLGTPGGTTSLATDINNAGRAVGAGQNAAGETRAFVWVRGTLHVLDPLPGHHTSIAFAINARNRIAGASCDDDGCNAVLWRGRNATPREIKTLEDGQSIALDINDRNQVVGVYEPPSGPISGFLTKDNKVAFIKSPTDPSARVDASAINNRGVVVGNVDGSAKAFAWQNGTMEFLESPSGQDAALGINDRGVIVGRSALNLLPTSKAVIWSKASPWRFWDVEEVGLLPGMTQNEAFDVNNAGEIVGSSWSAALGPRAFIFDGALSDLGDLGGADAEALAINNASQVTGWSENASGDPEAFFWEAGSMTGLGFIDPLAPFPSSRGRDINDSGWIVGASGQLPFLWVPPGGPIGDIGALPPNLDARAQGINSAGLVAGTSCGPVSNKAVQWDPGAGPPPFPNTAVALANLNDQGRGHAINDSGQITGFFDGPNSKEAYVWANGTVTTFFHPSTVSEASAINNDGRVVGTAGLTSLVGFMWEKGWLYILPSLDGGPIFEGAHGLNEGTKIVGFTQNAAFERRALLWTKK